MCKFHKDVARAIATDPVSGQFDPSLYSVSLLVMAKYRIEQYMPAMFGCDGYSNYQMATPQAQAAFDQSGLAAAANGASSADIAAMRDALLVATAGMDLSRAALHLPKNPVKDTRFLDEATVELFDGPGYYTKANIMRKGQPPEGTPMGYVDDEIAFLDAAHKPAFEPIRAAATAFLAQPGVDVTLTKLFKESLAEKFSAAPDAVQPMLLDIYQRVPARLRATFKSCAACVSGGAGGALTSHAGCVIALGVSSAGNAALGTGASLGLSGVFTAAGLGAWYGLRGRFAGMGERALVGGSALAGMALVLGTHLGGGHDGHAGHAATAAHAQMSAHSPHTLAVAQKWLAEQPKDYQENIAFHARLSGRSPAEEALNMCSQDLTVRLRMEEAQKANTQQAILSR